MASGDEPLGRRLLAGLKFWLIVGVICAVVGAIAFLFGRDYVGSHLHEMEVTQRAPQIQPRGGEAAAPGTEDSSDNPPMKPVITVSEREPTAREERTARRELAQPQDGAQLNAARRSGQERGSDADDAEDADEAPAEGRAEDERAAAPERSGKFVVTAGAFADQVNAERQVQRLAERGYQPFITTIERDGATYRRVNVGVFDSRDQAERLTEQLRSQGFDAAVGTGQG